MYYRTKQNDLTIERLKQNLSQSLKQSYQIYFKKGSKFKFLQFIGRKDSLIIRKNAFYGYKLYIVNTKNHCEISIDEYIPSGYIRNNPIPLGVWNILIYAFYKIGKKEFYSDLINSLYISYEDEIRTD